MRGRLATAVVLGGAVIPGRVWAGEPVIVDRRWGYQIEIPDGWTPKAVEGDLAEDILIVYRHEDGDRLLFVSKMVGPAEEPDLETLEGSLKARARGYKRLSAKKRMVGEGRRTKVAAWDVWFKEKRDGRTRKLGSRFLFYKSYVLSILVDASGRGRAEREARKIVESFVPPPPPK